MKALTRLQKNFLMFLMFMALAVPTYASGTDSAAEKNAAKTEEAASNKMVERLMEIKKMDKSNLSRTERKALRKEVKEIKTTLKASNNGVYLSVGAIIIIILLLILIL
jgi:ABC-type transport system involved in cytochrome bd biosynthesis fused ATPase/permease subunit